MSQSATRLCKIRSHNESSIKGLACDVRGESTGLTDLLLVRICLVGGLKFNRYNDIFVLFDN
jgi:hypothetical protein